MKNYIVKMKSVSNVVNMADYLLNEKHKNHKNTKEIIELTNNYEDFLKANLEEEAELEIKKQLAKKGGRPSKETTLSFTLNFPKSYKVNQDQVKKINDLVLEDLANYLNIELEELKRKSYSVQHVQDNEHYHLLVSSILNKKKNRVIRSRSALTFIKKSFTMHTDKILNTSIEKYKAKATTEECYDKQDILIANKQTKLAIKHLIKNETDTKNIEYLEKTLNFLETGKSQKATNNLKKYKSKNTK